MANIVQQTSKVNHQNHSTFDLSGSINLTTAPGMLLPLRVDDALPNSRYTFNYSAFARTIQMVVPAFARVKAHIDTFFVPYRLLGTDYQATIVGDERGKLNNYNSEFTFSVNHNKGIPYFNLRTWVDVPQSGKPTYDFGSTFDAAGVQASVSAPILLNALGYGIASYPIPAKYAPGDSSSDNISSHNAISSKTASDSSSLSGVRSVSYLQAYQKIYQDFYRNKLWEKENKYSYFCDSSEMGADLSTNIISRGMLEMRYKDFDKDRFMGLVPDERGILSEGISQYASSILNGSYGLDSPFVLGNSQVPNGSSLTHALSDDQQTSELSTQQGNITVSQGMVQLADQSNATIVQQYTALTQRRMEAFQKFAEITQLNKSDYKHQIKAHFGFTPSNLNSDYATLLNSMDFGLSISDVENTTGTNQGYLAGKGVMSGNSSSFTVDCQEHGIIMSILYILPQIDWTNDFVDRGTIRYDRYDFAIPEFDRLGFEPIRALDIFGSFNIVYENDLSVDLTSILGYLPRYWFYKTRVDVNTTGFNSSDDSSLNFNNYIVRYPQSQMFEAFKAGTMYKAFKCRPSILDNLFPTSWTGVESNPFVFNIYVGCKASLPLSIDSLPYQYYENTAIRFSQKAWY